MSIKKFTMIISCSSVLFFTALSVSVARGNTIIFQTNFDKCTDWSIAQTSSNKSNVPNSWTNGQADFPCGGNANTGTGARWVAWYESRTYLSTNVNNTVTLGSSNSKYGKAITHSSEVPIASSGGEASDGSLYLSLTTSIGDPTQGYDEIWITVWRKYDSVTPYYTAQNMQKFIHVSSYDASKGSITDWFSDKHLPSLLQQTQGDNSKDSYGYKYRWLSQWINLYPNANRNDYTWVAGDLDEGIYKSGAGSKYINVYAKLASGTQHGGWQQSGNYGDGNYYYHEYHLKMNSSPGVADGVYEYFINGIAQVSVNNVPFVKSGAQMVRWNLVVFGGNNDYYNTGGEYETYYAYDDIVVSDYRVGQSYQIPFDYYVVTGANQFEPTDTRSYPDLLGSYIDVYGTTVRRMTTEAGSVRPNYTARTSTIENSDGTLFAVNSYVRTGSSWEIFTTSDGIYRATLKAFLYGATDYDHFVWSNTTPNVGYLFVASRYGYAYDSYPAKFYKITINVSTWVVSGELLYTYAREDMPTCPDPNTLFWVKNHDEGPPSWDGRYWASTLHCSNSTSENYPYALLLTDRDLGGSESPGVKGYVILPQWYASNAGVSPGGNYFFWKEYGTTSCGSEIYCVKFFPVASVSGNTNYSGATRLSTQNAGSHFNVQYDDLGNEVYVSGLSGSGIVYWRFNTAPSSAIIMAPWSYTRATGAKVGDTHSIVAGVKEGPRSWVVVLTTDGDYPECGGENLGNSTITYMRASATNPRVFRAAHARHEAVGYGQELFGGASRDGTKLYFQSNWCGAYNQQLFRAELPSTWYQDILSNIPPDTTPPAAPTGVTIN